MKIVDWLSFISNDLESFINSQSDERISSADILSEGFTTNMD